MFEMSEINQKFVLLHSLILLLFTANVIETMEQSIFVR